MIGEVNLGTYSQNLLLTVVISGLDILKEAHHMLGELWVRIPHLVVSEGGGMVAAAWLFVGKSEIWVFRDCSFCIKSVHQLSSGCVVA